MNFCMYFGALVAPFAPKIRSLVNFNEAQTYNTGSSRGRGPSRDIYPSRLPRRCPPPSITGCPEWRNLFGPSESSYRVPSVLMMGVALFLVGGLAVRLIHPQAAWFAVFASKRALRVHAKSGQRG